MHTLWTAYLHCHFLLRSRQMNNHHFLLVIGDFLPLYGEWQQNFTIICPAYRKKVTKMVKEDRNPLLNIFLPKQCQGTNWEEREREKKKPLQTLQFFSVLAAATPPLSLIRNQRLNQVSFCIIWSLRAFLHFFTYASENLHGYIVNLKT